MTDILFFNRKEKKRTKLKDCKIIEDFLFSRNNFYLVYKGGLYFVCASVNGELVSLWHMKEYENGEKNTPNAVLSAFRRGYLKNGIVQSSLDLFLKDPLEYEKAKKK